MDQDRADPTPSVKRDTPIQSVVGKKPKNLKGKRLAGGKDARKVATSHIANDPTRNSATVNEAGMVTQFEVVDGAKVVLENTSTGTTFYYTDKLPLNK